MKKVIFIMIIALLTVNFTYASEVESVSFKDVNSDYYAKDAIYAMAKKGVVQGLDDYYFGTEEYITREQLAKVICKSFGIQPLYSDTPYYSDVNITMWSFGYAQACKNLFFMNDGMFEPGKYVTREEIAYVIVKGLGYDKNEIRDKEVLSKTFRDAMNIDVLYRKAVALAVEEDILKGYDDNTFRAKNKVDRGEAMLMLFNITGGEVEQEVYEDRGSRKLDVVMMYDMDHGASINDRPDNGWWPLNKEYPNDPVDKGLARVTTPLLGTYDSSNAKVIKQHFYWMAALGCNGVQCDFTNWCSPRQPDALNSSMKFYKGLLRSFETQLKVISETKEFESPKVYGMMRLNGKQYENLQYMVDDMYTLYEKYPNSWYKLNDGSDRKDKPFLLIFADWNLLKEWTDSTIPYDDQRFNIRWGNGFLANVDGATTVNNLGERIIEKDTPFWLFVENEEMPGKDGYYRPIYKVGQDEKPEQMITWASLWKGGDKWDGLLDKIDDKLTIQRYTEPVYKIKPKVLVVSRWNYPLAWLEEPQEGVSRNKSTHIEPNVDWGFQVFNNVSTEMYKLNEFKQNPPPKPYVTEYDSNKNIVSISLNGFPLEYRISNSKNFNECAWAFLNVADGGIKLKGQVDATLPIFIQTRNTFGESQTTTYRVSAQQPQEPPDSEEEPDVIYIKTIDDLKAMESDGKYKLMATIDLSESDWISTLGFNGEFDGNSVKGYSLQNLKGTACNGLFNVLGEGSIVKNLVIENVDIIAAGSLSGIIASKLVKGRIENCAVIDGKIQGANYVGGFVGANDHGTISQCLMSGEVYSTDGIVGGIVGYSEFAENDSCYFNGKVECTTSDVIGGIVGKVLGGTDGGIFGVANCYATGTVNGSASGKYIGGIAGIPQNDDGNWPAPIINCFALQREITGGNAGRITSITTKELKNNSALDLIKVNNIEKGSDNKDGEAITQDQSADWDTYEKAGWDSSVWEMSDGGVPILKWLDKSLQ